MGHQIQSGIVRNLRRGEESGSGFSSQSRVEVVSFRLELTEPGGDITGYHQIEMRGYRITGDVAEGDRVQVDVWKSQNTGILATRLVRNVTTDSFMGVTGSTTYLEKVKWTVFFVLFFGGILLAVFF